MFKRHNCYSIYQKSVLIRKSKGTICMFMAFCIPYLGPWPKWTPLFLNSCSFNSAIDFLLFSDRLPGIELPSNVRHYKMNSAELSEKFSKGVGTQISIVSGHKMCDFKPFYGRIFQEYLTGYQFWGYCDIDLVFGDLSKSLTPEALANVDVFTPYDKYPVGHCTVIRNCEVMNSLCMSIKDYVRRSAISKITFMDELGFNEVLNNNNQIRFKKPENLRLECNSSFAAIGLTIKSSNEIDGLSTSGMHLLKWQNGRTMLMQSHSREIECLYIHFMGMKIKPFWILFSSSKKYNCFVFSPMGFLPFSIPANIVLLFLLSISGVVIDSIRNFATRFKQKKYMDIQLNSVTLKDF
ncbi:MAG: hypothetical protein JXB49_35485 [Bacteroidales bacterium]|nr:hypothetical protein [Bacteroidales bacterium]